MNRRVLWVDDEPAVLKAVAIAVRTDFDLRTVGSGAAALEEVQANGPYAVIVSDRDMPGMDGVDLLAHVRRVAPETVRVMCTGMTDRDTAIEAINRGEIFRFLSKPLDLRLMRSILEGALEQHRLIIAEEELLLRTLSGAVRILNDALSLSHPEVFGRSARIRQIVSALCRAVHDPDAWQTEIAATLARIGLITVPETTLRRVFERGSFLDDDEPLFIRHPAAGRALIANIPRLEGVAEIVGYQHQRWDGLGFPGDGRSGSQLPLGSRILMVAQDYDLLTGSGVLPETALRRMLGRRSSYDPEVFSALSRMVLSAPDATVRVPVSELEIGMVLTSDIVSATGAVLVRTGQEVTEAVRQRLNYFQDALGTGATVAVVPAVGSMRGVAA